MSDDESDNKNGWGEPKETESWQHSEAKELLIADIIRGDIPDDMEWEEAFLQRPEFVLTKRRLFASRLKSCREQAKETLRRADEDAVAWEQSRKLCPAPVVNHRGEPTWEGSQAQRQLKDDFSSAEAKGVPAFPTQLCYSRRAHCDNCSLKTTRQHICQEKRFVKCCTWRNDKAEEMSIHRRELHKKTAEREEKEKKAKAKKKAEEEAKGAKKNARAKKKKETEKESKQTQSTSVASLAPTRLMTPTRRKAKTKASSINQVDNRR